MKHNSLCASRRVGLQGPVRFHSGGDQPVADAFQTALLCYTLYAHLRASAGGKNSDLVWGRLATFLDEMNCEVDEAGELETVLTGWMAVFWLLLEELDVRSIDPEFHRLCQGLVECSIRHAAVECGTAGSSEEATPSILSDLITSLADKRNRETPRLSVA